MGEDFKDYKNENSILYCEPRVKNKFLRKFLLKLFGENFGYKFLYKYKWITPENLTIKTFYADDVPIDKEKFNGDVTIEL